ncbi:MAG: TonB-dependent receptor [Novosphingobium sp.]|uniref:TonB-dependent receptor n=1 Tax=Novosphingobium sp. TaxID=1874826 RepID=UPI003C7A1E73
MNRFTARSSASLAVLAFALGHAAPSFAAVTVTEDAVTVDGATDQNSTGTPPATDGSDASPESAGDTSSDTGLTDIVVTATKRETNLQRTPISISVIGGDVIEKRHVQSLLDLADGGVPSLRVATFESRQSALTVGVRGIVPFDQNQVAREPGVGVYIDGVYLGRSQGLNAALFDVQRIEVLRGPQGTLFGRNTEGGALSIVTKAPTGEFGGRMQAGVGSYGAYNGEFHLDLPAFANFAVKIDGVIDHQDATTTNPASGQYGWNYHNRVGGRIAVRWTPVSDLTVDLSYDQAKDENTPFYSQLINYNPNGYNVGTYAGTTLTFGGSNCNVLVAGVTTNPCIAPLAPLVQVAGSNFMSQADFGVTQQPSVDQTHGFSATVKYKLSPDIELRSITAWRGVEAHQWDGSAGAHRSTFVPNGAFGRYSLSELYQHQFSQEVQVVGSLSQVDFVLGGYYFNEHARETAATPNPQQWNATGTGYTFINQVPANPTGAITSTNQGWTRNYWFVQRDSFAVGKSYGVFGQATWSPAETLHITAGGRYTHETRKGALTVINNAPFPGGLLDYSNSRFDPMVTLAWDAADGINLYAKYSTGFRSGGANSRSGSFREFAPESVRSYEIGAKTDFLDHHVRLNIAAYIMNRAGTQIDFDYVDTNRFLADGVTANPFFNRHTEETANAPSNSPIRGIEAELTVRPFEGLTLGASYAYTDVKVPATPNPLAGPLFGIPYQVFSVYTPKNAVSGSFDYEMPVGSSGAALRLHFDANYADPAYSFQSENVLAESSFVVNGSIALAAIPLPSNGTTATISLWSRNLFNEHHIYRRSDANTVPTVNNDGSLNYSGVLGSYGNFNPPRTFGIEGTIKF